MPLVMVITIIGAIARHFDHSFVFCFFTVYEHWLCSIQPIAGTFKVPLAKWQNPCYNVYVSFRIATEQLQWMSNTVPEDEHLQALFCFFCLSQTEAQTGTAGSMPPPCYQFHIWDPWVQKRLESFGSLSSFLYRSEPNRSLTLCSGEPFGIPVRKDSGRTSWKSGRSTAPNWGCGFP